MARPVPVAHPECPPGLVEVLDYVRRRGSCTRAQLVEATGLSRALIGQRLAALADYGLVAEGGVGPSTGGRAPRTVRFCADAGHLLVADLGATSIDVAVADLAGGILAHAAEPADIAAGPDVVLGRVEALFEECADRVRHAGRAVRHRHRRPRPRRVRRRAPDLAADHAGLGRLQRAGALRALRRAGPDRQRRERDGARRAHDRARPRARELRLREDRHRDRRRDHRQRRAVPRLAGLRRRHRPHPDPGQRTATT